MLIQPTSPFRTKQSILAALSEFKSCESIVSVSACSSNPEWVFQLESQVLVKPAGKLQTLYELNGLIYLCTPNFLTKNQRFITNETRGIVIDSKKESLDIDTQADFELAEFYLDRDL